MNAACRRASRRARSASAPGAGARARRTTPRARRPSSPGAPVCSASRHACACIETSSRPPNAPPTPASVNRTFSTGRSRQAATWSRSTCSHWVAMHRSTPPSSAGTASPDSGPRNAWSCIPTSYSPVTTTSASPGSGPCSMCDVAQQVAGGMQRRRGRIERVLRIDQRLQHLVVDLDPRSGVPRRLRMVGGDDRHRLALVADLGERQHRLVVVLEPVRLAARHVLVREHRVHAAARRAPPRCRSRGCTRADAASAASRPTASRRPTCPTSRRTRP